ncbi:hypothetical protein EJ08DRAFT_640730 [Tothia fuscella]|uniref:Zinc finger C2H2 LYAR-type domain-containing protein n=1 Tax=Tothia fuscella TaxID=1048955 RepID=A0A9P4NI57_9PEZI|nr:hypothetical protein EJ08DRAFT_640730 [Tothia fuscella]
MVSFSCNACGDVLTKKKLDPHRNQCRGAQYTCLDCMVDFHGVDYRTHTSCISEAQKYQGALYKEKPKKGAAKATTHDNSQALVPRKAYVEDEADAENRVAVVDAPPRAPSPPPQAFNVFEFLVDDGRGAPSPPSLEEDKDTNLLDEREWESDPDDMEAERYDSGEDAYAAAREYMKEELLKQGYTYGAEPVTQGGERFDSYTQLPISPAEHQGPFFTPAPPRAGHQRNISNASMDSATKESNKKRKRGHVEDLDLSRSRDVVMTDVAPPTHSGLTGGLNRMIVRPNLPPSPPDVDASPHSPLKRTKHSASEKERGRTRETKDKDKKSSRKSSDKKDSSSKEKERKKHKSSRTESDSKAGRWERRRVRKDSDLDATTTKESAPSPPQRRLKAIEPARTMKAIEYRPQNSDDAPETPAPTNGNGAMIIHPQKAIDNAEHFMGFVTKGPESERGCSINKVLKRYNREKGGKGKDDEKDLWKVLRLRRNERGEVVLFIEGVN